MSACAINSIECTASLLGAVPAAHHHLCWVLCVWLAQAWMPKLVEIGIDLVMNSTHDKEQDALLDLLIHFHAQVSTRAVGLWGQ